MLDLVDETAELLENRCDDSQRQLGALRDVIAKGLDVEANDSQPGRGLGTDGISHVVGR